MTFKQLLGALLLLAPGVCGLYVVNDQEGFYAVAGILFWAGLLCLIWLYLGLAINLLLPEDRYGS